MPARKSFVWKILLTALLLAGGLAAAWFYSRPVARVVTIEGGTAVNAVPGSVVVRAERDEQLKSEVNGRLKSTTMVEGASFKKGDILAQLDTADLELEIEQTETDLNAAKRRAELDKSDELVLEAAQGDLDNAKRVFKQGMLSEFDLQKAERAFRKAEQSLELARLEAKKKIDTFDNSLRTKQRQLEKMTIRAPFDGVVARLFAKENALISEGTALANLISVARIVEAKVSEENFAGVKLGQKARVLFLGYNGTFDATVVKMLPTADAETQRYIVHLEVDIESKRLVPGITGEVTIVIGERTATALVPRRALFGHSVWVVKDGIVEARPIQLGYVSLNVVEVSANLAPGEQVIIDDIDQFRAGQRVRVQVREARR